MGESISATAFENVLKNVLLMYQYSRKTVIYTVLYACSILFAT